MNNAVPPMVGHHVEQRVAGQAFFDVRSAGGGPEEAGRALASPDGAERLTAMPTFLTADGTKLAYRMMEGDGDPVVCLPGGPMQDSTYLGDLGGLPARRRLAVLDLRGTGRSAIPEDSSSYRCDRQVDDVEALRQELGLDRIDLLGHSAGTNLVALYAVRHPERVGKLALIAPSALAFGVATTGETRREIGLLRRSEPWFTAGFAALERITSGQGEDSDWATVDPFFYGRWDDAAKDHRDAGDRQINREAAEVFGSEGAFLPEPNRVALAVLDLRSCCWPVSLT